MANAQTKTAPAATPPVLAGAALGAVRFDPTTVTIKKVLTVPLIKLRAGMTIYVKALAAMFEAKPIKNAKEADKDKKAPTLLQVLDLETGALAQIILGTILADIFNDEYPQNAYIGKGFKIIVGEQKASQAGGGKRYNQYEVYEIEI